MADTITSSTDLKIQWEFADGDTSTQSVKNPRYDLTSSELQSFAANVINNKIIIGDKNGADVTKLNSAVTKDKATVILDIA